MKKILLILFILISVESIGNTYYVATDGNDSNPGTMASPWKTWYKGMMTADAGDTVFFRGGVYDQYPTNGNGIVIDPRYPTLGNSGTRLNPIIYINYPTETPILDCSNVTPASYWNRAIRLAYAEHIKFIGLHIRNVLQTSSSVSTSQGINIGQDCNNITCERMVIYNIGHSGFTNSNYDSIYYINCDAYNICDSLSVSAPGNGATGFSYNNTDNDSAYVYIYGCRAWNCGDDGFAGRAWGHVKIERCWSFRHGRLTGLGNGFKLSGLNEAYRSFPPVQRELINSLAVYNRFSGINLNDNGLTPVRRSIYNNTVYKTGTGERSDSYGIQVWNTTGTDAQEYLRVFKNNISYNNEDGEIHVYTNAVYTHEYNSWDTPPGVTLSDADFVSVDSTGLTGARQADGSLPILTFLHINAGSDLIGAGIGVGLTYDGDSLLWDQETPSLGAYEYDAGDPPPPPPLPTITTSQIIRYNINSSSVLVDTLSSLGVTEWGICYATTINPTTSESKVTASEAWGTGVEEFDMTGLSENTTYHVRAYATNTSGTTYGEDLSFLTPEYAILQSGGKALYSNGKILIVK